MREFLHFKNLVEELDKKIRNYYANLKEPLLDKKGNGILDDYGNLRIKNIIQDGLANLHKYFHSKFKILWVLKEPYDKENDGAGGWSVTQCFNKEWLTKGMSRGTWFPIIYTSYAILNNIKCYDDMDNIPDKPEMIDILQNIAFINVSKFPGETRSNNNFISKQYKKHKQVLLKQVEVYTPDIIIGGNTIHNFLTDLDLTEEEKHYDEYEFWLKEGKLYIHANHPGWKRGACWEEEYVDSILNIFSNYWKTQISQKSLLA